MAEIWINAILQALAGWQLKSWRNSDMQVTYWIERKRL